MRSILKDKRGNALGIIFVIVFVFIIAIIALLTTALSKKFSAEFKKLDIPVNSTADQAINRMDTMAPKIADELVFFLFIGLNIGLIVSAVKTRFSVAVIFIFLILLIFAVVIAAGLTNLYTEFAGVSVMSVYSGQMPLTGFIFNRFTPLIICILSGLTMLIMYGKQTGGNTAF